LGIVFLYAAIGKIDNPETFAKEISNYRLIPDVISRASAIILPWIELAIGFLLVFGIRTRTVSFISFVLLFLFTFMVGSAWARGLNIDCGCFSHRVEYVGIKKIIENLLLMAMSISIFYFPGKFLSLEAFLKRDINE